MTDAIPPALLQADRPRSDGADTKPAAAGAWWLGGVAIRPTR
ncbi:hypothetical protein [Catenulispora subtropica]